MLYKESVDNEGQQMIDTLPPLKLNSDHKHIVLK
jgi:hypothetical protein